jgi:tRNA-Thr(GGU) m(6)t(6)A37 methyltransferase TsaA
LGNDDVMKSIFEIKPIAHIRTDFPSKFGIPRQSGMVESLEGTIVFEPEYRNRESLRGLENYSHLWLIWGFSETVCEDWSPTVRPPRLGGNIRIGIFATRSPFRPNPIGLSCVRLEKIRLDTSSGPEIQVSGIDMMDETPIFDIKPYLPYTDCRSDATGGFTDNVQKRALQVHVTSELLNLIPHDKQKALLSTLSLDPRPSYQNDSDRIYGFLFSDFEIKFSVKEQEIFVVDIMPLKAK